MVRRTILINYEHIKDPGYKHLHFHAF
jgi:hypothetical protein